MIKTSDEQLRQNLNWPKKKKESNLGKMLNIGKDVEQTQLPYAVMVKK